MNAVQIELLYNFNEYVVFRFRSLDEFKLQIDWYLSSKFTMLQSLMFFH